MYCFGRDFFSTSSQIRNTVLANLNMSSIQTYTVDNNDSSVFRAINIEILVLVFNVSMAPALRKDFNRSLR